MSDKFEKTFEFAYPAERLWRAFTEPAEIQAWLSGTVKECDIRPGGRIVFADEGMGELEWEILEAEPGRRIRWREGPGLLPGATEVTVTFEQAGTGTKIIVTQSGFGSGEEWLGALEGHALGWGNGFANLQLYLRTGVRHDRMFTYRSGLGAITSDTPAAPEVLAVSPGSFADHAGLSRGDLIVGLGSAPIFDLSDIWLYTREHEAGEECDVMFVRDGTLQRGRAQLSPFGV